MYYLHLFFLLIFLGFSQANASLNEEQLNKYVVPPMQLGTKDEALPIWRVLNSGGDLIYYIFESADLVPIPGFSGGKMNLLISIDLEGTFLDVLVLEQSEPVFVSGIGIEPFNEFLKQYSGKSLASNIKIGKASIQNGSVRIDGISKATASVLIANESILASAIKVARERLAGIAPKPVGYPNKDIYEKLNWNQLIKKGLIQNLKITNKEIEELFEDTEFAQEDKIALSEPQNTYIDLWVADLGIPTVARNLLSKENINELNDQLDSFEEAILVLAKGRHQLVDEEFVRNSVPDFLEIIQDGFPISMRDADLDIVLLETVPKVEQAMIFQVDTRFGFDPSSAWIFKTKVIRKSPYFHANREIKDLNLNMKPKKEYFLVPLEKDTTPVWVSSWLNQKNNLIFLGIFITALFIALGKSKILLKELIFKRTVILLFTLFFIGWYGQGQLSMVTVLGFFKSIFNSQTLEFLLYDPFSLIIWGAVIISLFIWGRGTFCGWLCPYGVLQEFSHMIARTLNFPKIKISQALNDKLIYLKYLILACLLFTAIFAPSLSDYLLEIEPFKTSITLIFDRKWPYVVYALFWIFLSMFIFKGFCRFICPLGAFLSLSGKVRIFNWLPRRKECGNPCQQCNTSCDYKAIDKKDGHIKYDECFQCLVCVDIHHDNNKCSVLKLAKNNKFRKVK